MEIDRYKGLLNELVFIVGEGVGGSSRGVASSRQ